MNILKRFIKAEERILSNAENIAHENIVKLYGLYKQATVGDNTTPRPWSFQFYACAKWDEWTSHAGKNKEDAMSEYIGLSFLIGNQDA